MAESRPPRFSDQFMKLKLLILMGVAALFCGGCATTTMTHGIPNFAQVEPGIWRGGQPTDEGWNYLHSLGVKTDIKLNTEQEGTDVAADALGMQVFQVPVMFYQQIGLVRIDRGRFDDALNSMPATGVYIHCQHGQDRTGLFVAMWRRKVGGWLKPQAEQEMMAHGFHKELLGLWSFWERYDGK